MSKSDHARSPKRTKAKINHDLNEWEKNYLRRPRPRMNKRAEIVEGVFAYLDENDTAKQFYMDCEAMDFEVLQGYYPVSTWDENHVEHVHYEQPLPQWEIDLLHEQALLEDGDRVTVLDIENPLAEWEWNLLGGTGHRSYAAYMDEVEVRRAEKKAWTCFETGEDWWESHNEVGWREEDENAPGAAEMGWLPLMSIEEARDLFDGDFVTEGPKVSMVDWRSPQRYTRERHYRVWELAKEIGVNSADLVAWLREHGEYVKTHQSILSEAIWIDVTGMQAYLQRRLGKRPEATETDPIKILRNRLMAPGLSRPVGEFYERATMRPVPRPGNNPFAFH